MTNELALCLGFIDTHGDDAARAIERLSVSDAAALLHAIPAETAGRVLEVVMPTFGAECLARLTPQAAGEIVVRLRAPRAAVLLGRLDDIARAAILEHVSADEARILRATLTHAPGSAGALMDPRVFAANEGRRVSEVLAALRQRRAHADDFAFAVDDEHRLVGVVRVPALLAARPTEPLTAIMDRSVSRVRVSAGRAAILHHPGWRRAHALPVVDDGSVLVGVIPYETMRALIEEEALGGRTGLDAASTIVALGELYWLGLSGVLDGVAMAVRREVSRAREVPHGSR